MTVKAAAVTAMFKNPNSRENTKCTVEAAAEAHELSVPLIFLLFGV